MLRKEKARKIYREREPRLGNIDTLKEFGRNIDIHGFLRKPHPTHPHPSERVGDNMLKVTSILNKPLLRDLEITAAMSLDKNRIQHSYPSRPVKPYQDKDQQVHHEIRVDRTKIGEGTTLPPSYTLEKGSEMFSVKPHVTVARLCIIKDQERTTQPASTGPHPYPAPDSSLEIQEGVNSRVTKRPQWIKTCYFGLGCPSFLLGKKSRQEVGSVYSIRVYSNQVTR